MRPFGEKPVNIKTVLNVGGTRLYREAETSKPRRDGLTVYRNTRSAVDHAQNVRSNRATTTGLSLSDSARRGGSSEVAGTSERCWTDSALG
jgi:hypothetical protein